MALFLLLSINSLFLFCIQQSPSLKEQFEELKKCRYLRNYTPPDTKDTSGE